jgi:dihydropteroate synthase
MTRSPNAGLTIRPQFQWRLRSRFLSLGDRTLIMGILNVTPDSFSDGGRFYDKDLAVEHGLKLIEEGADIVDVGGESTRPGSRLMMEAEEEKRRVLPVIEGLLRVAPEAVISIDTHKAETALAALIAGAEIVNDVSGFTWDRQMIPMLAANQCGCVLMHTRGKPSEWKSLPPLGDEQVMPMVLRELRQLSNHALEEGISRECLVLDPGFGFGKRLDENYPLLAHFSDLRQLGFPLLSGLSRKSFLKKRAAAGADTLSPCDHASTAAIAGSVLAGAHIVRVHDAAAATEAIRVADAVLRLRNM